MGNATPCSFDSPMDASVFRFIFVYFTQILSISVLTAYYFAFTIYNFIRDKVLLSTELPFK